MHFLNYFEVLIHLHPKYLKIENREWIFHEKFRVDMEFFSKNFRKGGFFLSQFFKFLVNGYLSIMDLLENVIEPPILRVLLET